MKSCAVWIFSMCFFGSQALANVAVRDGFATHYPKAPKTIVNCKLCHELSAGMRKNVFGEDLDKALNDNGYPDNSEALGLALSSIESLDSDGDGFKNIDEINQGTFPGDQNSHP